MPTHKAPSAYLYFRARTRIALLFCYFLVLHRPFIHHVCIQSTLRKNSFKFEFFLWMWDVWTLFIWHIIDYHFFFKKKEISDLVWSKNNSHLIDWMSRVWCLSKAPMPHITHYRFDLMCESTKLLVSKNDLYIWHEKSGRRQTAIMIVCRTRETNIEIELEQDTELPANNNNDNNNKHIMGW